ncbi:MAG: YggS family pyridoxal phosphate-dependent enzyme [Gemmataceae bacterium]|nr:YggS family pyridoxal phosphate-dependent enzyme [Gemmataceae bacterium]
MTPAEPLSRLQANIDSVRRRIAAACDRVGRSTAEVTLVAVTKYVSADLAAHLPRLGIHDLGESRPQELWHKAKAIPHARWHLVGHLQRNKVEATLPLACLIHSVDSERLLVELQRAADKLAITVAILLEINVSGESAKHGFAPAEVPPLLPQFPDRFPRLRMQGLMTMAPISDEPERVRPVFRDLRRLRDEWARQFPALGPLPHLSMGMTQDFEVAIEEGATLVRIGSALFEGLVQP